MLRSQRNCCPNMIKYEFLIVPRPCVQMTVLRLDCFHAYQSLPGKVLINLPAHSESLSAFLGSFLILYDGALNHKDIQRKSGHYNNSCPVTLTSLPFLKFGSNPPTLFIYGSFSASLMFSIRIRTIWTY